MHRAYESKRSDTSIGVTFRYTYNPADISQRSHVLTAAMLKDQVFWDTTVLLSVKSLSTFGRRQYLHFQGRDLYYLPVKKKGLLTLTTSLIHCSGTNP